MKPKRYRALHITPGVVDYTDGDQRETVLIKKPALDKMNRSFLGKPVFNFTHKVVPIEDAFNFTSEEIEEHAVGVVSDVGYDVESGYFFADMMIWDEETQDNISEGYKVSDAYIPEVGPGGEYNNVPYDEEVMGGKYDHMAIVENPRYGDVKIFENSKGVKPMKWKIFGKKEKDVKKNADDSPPADDDKKKDDEMSLNADSVLMGEDGEEYPLSEMIEAYKSANMKDEKPTMNMEDTIEIDGKDVSMKELHDNYCAHKNAEPPTDEALDDVVDADLKKNSAGEDGKKEKANDNFLKIKTNASKGARPEKIKVNTVKSRLQRGSERYGSAVKVEGGN